MEMIMYKRFVTYNCCYDNAKEINFREHIF